MLERLLLLVLLLLSFWLDCCPATQLGVAQRRTRHKQTPRLRLLGAMLAGKL